MTAGLVFYPKSHRYKLDGAWVPGVTRLISEADLIAWINDAPQA